MAQTGLHCLDRNEYQERSRNQDPKQTYLRQELQIVVVGVVLHEFESGSLELLKRRLIPAGPTPENGISGDQVQSVLPYAGTVFRRDLREAQNQLNRRQNSERQHDGKT